MMQVLGNKLKLGGRREKLNSLAAMGGVAALDPLSLSPALWLKADAGLYQERTGASATTPAASDADPVGTWLDQSGNGRHLTAASDSVRPTLKLAIQNGKPVVRFDGVDDFLKATFTLAQPSYFACAGKLTAGSRFFDGGITDTGDFYTPSANTLGLFAGSAVAPTVAFTPGTFYLFEVLFSGASSYIRINGGTTNTGNPGVVSMGGLTLGARADGVAPGSIDVGEVVCCAAEPSAGDRILLRTYMNSAWGTP